MILKKLPPVGKRKINQAFFEGEKTEKAWQEEEEVEVEVEVEEKADVDKGVESNREIQMRKK